MAATRPLLMIPGPIEVSPAVLEQFAAPPPGHLAPPVIEAFGSSLEMMRRVWCADGTGQPFVIAGGGTAVMDMAVANLIEPGERALVVNTGYFSDRLTEMLRRQEAQVVEVCSAVGDAPAPSQIGQALDAAGGRVKAVFATHVDTSTGVRIDPRPIASLAREREVLSVFDGVCATAAERFDMGGWDADVYLTASQKALGLPPGLALLVASERALESRRARLASAPPMYIDWLEWLPIMQAYEQRRPAYFSTPATNLILALNTGLAEILASGMDARFVLHERVGRAMRAAWESMGLSLVPSRVEFAANTLSALKLPVGVDATLVADILDRGVVVAGGLHPEIKTTYFRVGHMGYAATRPDMLQQTIEAIGGALSARGCDVDPSAAVAALHQALEDTAIP